MHNGKKIEIKNGSLKTTDYIYVGFPIIMLILSVLENDETIRIIGILICVFFLGFFLYMIVKRLKDKTVKIELSETNINIIDEKLFIPWSRISELEIIRGKSDLFDILVHYLVITIETKTSIQTKSVNLEEYNFNKKEVLDYAKGHIDKYFDKNNNTYCG